jgi:hypothetical protein
MNPPQGLHLISEKEQHGGRSITYRFVGQISGRGYFAEVHLQKISIGTDDQLSRMPHHHSIITTLFQEYCIVYAALDKEYHKNILFGICYALSNHLTTETLSPCIITVSQVIENTVDTTSDTMAYAAAFATWELLELQPENMPSIKNHQICFPGKNPTIPRTS